MNFQEKLKLLGDGVNKSRKARSVGLPATMISTYIAKGSIPRGDIALKMSKALDVPLEWLLDDSQNWPPPEKENKSIRAFSDGDLIAEVARRHRDIAKELLDDLAKAATIDWQKATIEFKASLPGKPLPSHVARALSVLHSFELNFNRYQQSFDPIFYASVHHDELPGSERDVQDFMNITEAYMMIADRPDVGAFAEVLKERPDASDPATHARFDRHRSDAIKFFRIVGGKTSNPKHVRKSSGDVEIT
ncbi:MAG TPA: helix-turn-helix transcriptional regulator [Tepidisphaeraceae bacterium]|jgi:hypothetical protein